MDCYEADHYYAVNNGVLRPRFKKLFMEVIKKKVGKISDLFLV